MLNRREFITRTAGGVLLLGAAPINTLLAQSDRLGRPIYSGWVPNQRETLNFKTKQRIPMFAQAGQTLAGSGKGKRALLWKYFEKVTGGNLIPHDQSIGDCVAQSYALGIDITDAVQIAHGRGEWVAKAAITPIYAGGRIEIGKGRITRDGMHGVWAGQWCRDYGVLLRQSYLDGKYDFTRYSGVKARKWGHYCRRCTEWGGGVPDELELLAKDHPLKTITLVTTWEQARDALYNGYPIIVCSNVGFERTRDRDGFLRKHPRYPAPKGVWFHSMLLAGMDDTGKRPSGLFINSWGLDWVKGPTRLGQPGGSFWADADVIEEMLLQEDSFAISNYVGYPQQELDYQLY